MKPTSLHSYDTQPATMFSPENVLRIYTELQPCAGRFNPYGGCRDLLTERYPHLKPEFDWTNPRALWGDLSKDGLKKMLNRRKNETTSIQME